MENELNLCLMSTMRPEHEVALKGFSILYRNGEPPFAYVEPGSALALLTAVNSHEALVKALKKSLLHPCGCSSSNFPGWHARTCFVPGARAALTQAGEL